MQNNVYTCFITLSVFNIAEWGPIPSCYDLHKVLLETSFLSQHKPRTQGSSDDRSPWQGTTTNHWEHFLFIVRFTSMLARRRLLSCLWADFERASIVDSLSYKSTYCLEIHVISWKLEIFVWCQSVFPVCCTIFPYPMFRILPQYRRTITFDV